MTLRALLPVLLLTFATSLGVACGGSASPATVTPAPSIEPTARETATVPATPSQPTSPTPPPARSPASSATTAPATRTAIPTSSAGTRRLITDADDRQTVVVSVGAVLVLALDTSFDWSDFTVSDPTVLEPYQLADPPAGSQRAYYATRAGEVTLSATGTVHCDPGVACPQIARLFRVAIRITP